MKTDLHRMVDTHAVDCFEACETSCMQRTPKLFRHGVEKHTAIQPPEQPLESAKAVWGLVSEALTIYWQAMRPPVRALFPFKLMLHAC